MNKHDEIIDIVTHHKNGGKVEEWKDIEGYEGLYRISSHGNVFSLRRNCIKRQDVNNKGYKAIQFCVNKSIKKFLVHRLVALHFVSGFDSSKQVNHIDGNKKNNYYKNLEWVTYLENRNHAIKNGASHRPKNPARGVNHPHAKLTRADIFEIKRLSSTMSGNDIAKIFKVKKETIYNVLNRKTYRGVLMPTRAQEVFREFQVPDVDKT